MTVPAPRDSSTDVNIAGAERATGLSKDTLRVWERRYGFPTPHRDAAGERLYPLAQIERLRLLKRLVDAGERPGRLMALAHAELEARLRALPQAAAEAESAQAAVDEYIDILKSHDVDRLRRQLGRAREQLGLARFVTEVVAPLNTRVGDAWMRGQLQVFEEHLYTESIQVLLREAIARLPVHADAHPRVLLTTFTQEPHGLGLLMAEGLLSLEGARCVSLGTATPIWDIVLAAAAQRADVVALSFSGCMNPNQIVDGLTELRAKLPASVELWAGGAAPALHRRPVAGVRPIVMIDRVREELAAARRQRSAKP
ncbi:MerR family transcriptional regulator [Piscinibacter aquaticus]|uniref:MerR family transcriptional regulator n=1 Tax=Piscinibacter aquaticus TaxID=392597 RepID=A0A5C6U2C4_9BURK|nr:MerR family transcriptional regulator [Piscinibacter aquaticus]